MAIVVYIEAMKRLMFQITLVSLSLGAIAGEPVGDCHFHLLDFLQNGEFDNKDSVFPGNARGLMENGRFFQLPYGQRYRRLTALLEVAERNDVVDVVVCGMPFVKKWAEDDFFLRPKYYLDTSSRVKGARDTDLQIASAFMDYKVAFGQSPGKLKKLDRLHPFVCGLDTTDLGAVDLAVKRIREYPGVWEGLGELMSRHDDLTNLTTGERPRGDHPSLVRLFKFAGLVSLPVSIHHNVAPVSRGPQEVKKPHYLREFVSLLEQTIEKEGNPRNRPQVIWCHAGISRRIVVENYTEVLEGLLQRFPENLHLDLSWVVLADYVYKDIDAWKELIEKYPENFVIGSDAVGKSSSIPFELKKFDALLNSLGVDTARKVRSQNLRRILESSGRMREKKGYGQKGITLPHSFGLPDQFGLEDLGN